MKHYVAPKPIPINYDAPFTKNLLGTLVATAKAQPNETETEYNARYAAIVTAWVAFGPRDPLEQMLAAQAVAAHYAALECLTLAAQTGDPIEQGKMHSRFAALSRSMRDTMRVLVTLRERPSDALPPPPVVKPEPPLRRAPIAAQPAKQTQGKQTQGKQSIQREVHRSPTGRIYDFTRDPAKMDDEELAAAIVYTKARIAADQLNGGESPHALNGGESPHAT